MTTLVFPGQGSQYIGMAKDFYDNFSKAKEVFDIIEENTKINIKIAALSIFTGLFIGLLFFPSQDFQSSILVGNIISIDNFSSFIKTNLLFVAFLISLIVPLLILFLYSLRNSFK